MIYGVKNFLRSKKNAAALPSLLIPSSTLFITFVAASTTSLETVLLAADNFISSKESCYRIIHYFFIYLRFNKQYSNGPVVVS